MSTEISTSVKERGYELPVFNALKSSVYPGAKDESVLMVLDYCKAANLNPMLKAVHIVPMSVKDAKTDKYEWRDTIMPGIALYRIQADRTGQCLGILEPEFGEDVTEKLGDKTITYPKWCKVVVRRLVHGNIAEYVGKELWKENYASAKNTIAPNTMWTKRPYGQIAKCAEAQALRRAFPELLGGQPTAEEMEGKLQWVNDEPAKALSQQKGAEGLKAVLNIPEPEKKEEENPSNVNLETGEIIDIEAIKQQIEQAKNNAELTDAAQKIAGAGDAISKQDKDELKKLYAARRDELKTLNTEE